MEISTFQKRKSVRCFADKEIEQNLLTQLIEFSSNMPALFQPLEHRVFWIYNKTAISEILSKFLLSYGKLVSAPYMLIPFYKPGPNADLEIGFMLEYLVLKATELGISTLWLSTDEFLEAVKAEFVKILKNPENDYQAKILTKNVPGDLEKIVAEMTLPVVILAGYPSEKRLERILNNAIRMESAGNSRKKIEALFATRKNEAIPEKLKKVLNHSILAPSKKNQQPWRVRMTPNGFDLGYLHDRKMDIGIFMTHVKVAMEFFHIPFKLAALEEKNGEIDWVVSVLWK